jgi:hypothetical protein
MQFAELLRFRRLGWLRFAKSKPPIPLNKLPCLITCFLLNNYRLIFFPFSDGRNEADSQYSRYR